MRLKLFAVHKCGAKLLHQRGLLLAQLGGIVGVNGGEVRIAQGIIRTVYIYCARAPVDAAHHVPILHAVFLAAVHKLALKLIHNYAYGLVHAGIKLRIARLEGLLRQLPRGENVRVAIALGREHGKRQKIYAVCIFQHVKIIVLHAVFYRRCNAHGAACRRAHPKHIVIAPLHVHMMVRHKMVEYNVRMGSAVEYVANDMQFVNGHALYKRSHFFYHGIRAACIDYCADYMVIIALLVGRAAGIEHFLHYIGIFPWQRLPYL